MVTFYNEVPIDRKAVAVTFDDGPDPVYTPQILDIFREAGAKATFFMVGEEMEKHPELAALVSSQGHEIGNHTFTHPDLTTLSDEESLSELLSTHRLIEKAAGVSPKVCRPPYLSYNERTDKIAAGLGYVLIGAANPEARDWAQPGVEHILQETRIQTKPGAIFLFHDGLGERAQTVEAIRILVSEWISQGYELVTVSELLDKIR